MKGWAINILLALLFTAVIFLLLSLAGTFFSGEYKFGFPFWFWKAACSISINPVTGEETGSTFEMNYLNLVLDIITALLPACLIVTRIKNQRAQTNLKKI